MSALKDIRVLDLSRVLAGPVCTQILGDLGADIIKVEKPNVGDDTRAWGPPFLQDKNGDTNESAYYLSANRNKRSVTIDFTTAEGQELIQKLLEKSDVLLENYKVGGLKKYGLDFESVHKKHPHIIYTSITGFGQDGPLAEEPGYDFLAQAMGGLMACTGEAGSEPMKAGVALSDVMTGQYAAIGILSALHARHESGKGQHIDLSLLDCTLAGMTNIAQYFLTSGEKAPRVGNAHSTIVPYQNFATKDGYVVIAIGNNGQFEKFCTFIEKPEWAEDEMFAKNSARVKNRETLVPMIEDIVAGQDTSYWVEGLRKIDVPVAPVNTMDQVFAMEQISARGMQIEMDHPGAKEPIKLVGSPLKLSSTPVTYNKPPPTLGAHTEGVLEEILGMQAPEIQALKQKNVV